MLGPYQNNPAGVGEYNDAVNASQKALELADGAEPWEQAFIEALAARYPDPGDGEAATESYAVAMKTVAESYADAPEAGTLYAESLIKCHGTAGRSGSFRSQCFLRRAVCGIGVVVSICCSQS